MFWFVPGGTIVHDRDTETIRLIDEEKLVHVDRSELVSAQGHTVTLSTGKTIPSDGIIFCIGWELSYPSMFAPTLAHEIGLPVDFDILSIEEKEYWQSLDYTSESRLLQRYPKLKDPPSNIHIRKHPKTPFRLFRSMFPPKLAVQGDNSLVILGNWANGKVQTTAEISSLWAVAYLEGLMPSSTKVKLTNLDEMNRDIALVDAFRRKRYLNGFQFRISVFDAPEFDDILMRELGLRPDRHRMRMPGGWRDLFGLKSWCAEWFEGYFASDYAGIVEEFLESVDKKKAVNGSKPLVNGNKTGCEPLPALSQSGQYSSF